MLSDPLDSGFAVLACSSFFLLFAFAFSFFYFPSFLVALVLSLYLSFFIFSP